MRISIIAGDNLFAYILARHVLMSIPISTVILSKYINISSKRIISIFKKTSVQYFIYRSVIQLISKVLSRFSISNWANKKNITLHYVKKKQDLLQLTFANDITIAFNFDMILPNEFILANKFGVINTHASNLPVDKGISPVVWAFCRGDKEIYISFYFMDGGVDSGDIIKKLNITIDPNWSLFRTYCEVLDFAGKELVLILNESFSTMRSKNSAGNKCLSETYNSWPDVSLHRRLRDCGRSYLNFCDIPYLYTLLSSRVSH